LNIDSTIIDAAKELRWIGRLGSGMEIIDTEYAASKSISCFSSPEGNCDAVAEHALGLVLSLFHRVVISSQQVKNGIWLREPNRGKELTGKTVGIIGYGHTGSRFAKLLAPFQVNVLAYDKYKKGFSSSLVREVELTEIFELSDVVSLHVPLTEATYHYADQQFFRALKRQPLFINTSRGKVVDTDALIVALDEGRISGAGIDVLENEDLASYTADENVRLHSLTDRDQVIVTPHIAGYTQEALFKMSDMLVQKLETAGML
jgi:D-3-phosphoglycerate dehydrogenase